MILKCIDKDIPELRLKHSACFYFDPIKKECAVYDDRPEVCRTWNCKEEWAESKGIFKVWEKLIQEGIEKNATK